MSNDQNYRPRSPDLPGFGSYQPPPRLEQIPSYEIQEPSLPQGYSFSPRGSYDASPFFSPSTQQPSTHYFGKRAGFQPDPYQSPTRFAPATLPRQHSQPHWVPSPSHDQPPPPLPYHSTFPGNEALFQVPRVPQQAQTFQGLDDMARLRQRKPVNYNENHNGAIQHGEPESYDQPPASMQTFPIAMQQQQQQQQQQHQSMALPPPPQQYLPPPQQIIQGPPHLLALQPQPPQQQIQATAIPSIPSNIDVRTKFPVARIKRIMQADEDVGKVAQATPTAVSKALELFMIALVTKGANEAKTQNSKRVTATHLKTALLSDPQFDFLNEICQSVPDEGSKKGRAKSEAKSEHDDIDSDDSGPAKKKIKAKKGKKASSDGESD